MMKHFDHRTLGRFIQADSFGDLRWEANVEMPEFSAFRYYGNGRVRRSKKVPVAIYAEEEPGQESIAVLLAIRRSQRTLIRRICEAFFNDYNQVGPDSGMWWRREPVQLALNSREALLKRVKREQIFHPEDFRALLYEPSIIVKPECETSPGVPRTLIDFDAEFEDEHGVSVLTDGRYVLGLGYSDEAEPYRDAEPGA